MTVSPQTGETGERRRRERGRLPALDGLRGFAIVLVIVHNAGSIHGARDSIALKLWAVVSNAGWVGVQLFFALSGYLITTILLNSKDAPGYFRNFYARRALRIMPLYYVFLAFIFFVAPHFSLFDSLAVTTPPGKVWYWTYMSNWVAPFASMPPALVHLWSLAVEEQFYLLWPLVVAALIEVRLFLLCLAIVAGSVAVRLGLHVVLPDGAESAAAYTFTIARWDAIALGAAVAIALRNVRWRSAIVPHIGLLLALSFVFATAIIAVERGFPAQGLVTEGIGQPLAGIVSAILVLACIVGDTDGAPRKTTTVVSRLMSVKPLRTIGKYSYAIYLFQTPVRLVLAPSFDGALSNGVAGSRFVALIVFVTAVFLISFAIALVSWRILEAPVLSLRRHFPDANQGLGVRG